MTEQRVSSRYARAIFQLAEEQNVSDAVLQDFSLIIEVVADSRELMNLLKSPVVPHFKKQSIFSEIFKGKISDITLQFLLLLTDKRRENILDSIIMQYVSLYNEKNNRLPIEVHSAVELSDDLKNSIVSKLEKYTGKTLIPSFDENAELKAGMLIRIEDWVFDATLKNQLKNLHDRLMTGDK